MSRRVIQIFCFDRAFFEFAFHRTLAGCLILARFHD